jgi:hypothetical protein
MADVGDTDCTKKRTPAWLGRTGIRFVLIAPIAILGVCESANATDSERLPEGRVAATAFAQGSSNGFLSGGTLMPATDTQSMDQRSDCTTRFTALVRDLDGVLASDPETINPVYEVFHAHFPVEKCKIEDVVAIARASRFFVRSWEGSENYSVAFNSAGVSSRPGFAVQISMAKKTGDLELPFAKVNGY